MASMSAATDARARDNAKYQIGLGIAGAPTGAEADPWFEGTTKFRIPQRNNYPEVYDHQLPEVDETINNNYPPPLQHYPSYRTASPASPATESDAAIQYPNSYPAYTSLSVAAKIDNGSDGPILADEAGGEEKKKRGDTICGLRKKLFWILIGLTVLVVVAAAVGLGVGIALSNRGGSPNTPVDDGTSGDGGNVTNIMALLPSTKLATANFTDEFGYENYLVFYQLRSNAIGQSAWNSSEGKWTTTIANGNTSFVRPETALSVSMFWHTQTTRDTRLYFVNQSGRIAGQITGNRGLAAKDSDWSPSGVSGIFATGNSSTLLSNGRETMDSYLGNMIIFQDESNSLRIVKRRSGPTDWDSQSIPVEFGLPVEATSLALVPAYQIGDRSLNFFYNGRDNGSLTHLSLTYDRDWTGKVLPTTLDPGAVIAAFSSGYNNTFGSLASNLTFQVLTAESGKAVQLTSMSGGEWRAEGNIPEMSGDEAPLTIAANQAGRVYGTVKRKDGSAKIVEWAWRGGKKYERIGEVDTSMPSG